jgi:hypothetical protein
MGKEQSRMTSLTTGVRGVLVTFFSKKLVGIRWKSLESLTLVQIVDDLDKSNQSHLKFVKNSLESPLLLSSKHLVSGFGEKEPKRTLKFLLSLRKSLKRQVNRSKSTSDSPLT